MAVETGAQDHRAVEPERWYARSPEEVAAAFGVDPAVGLSAARAAELLDRNGPNTLPAEEPEPGWRRFLAQYRSYMQIILVVAAVVSLLIREWGTAGILLVLTVINAVIGMRQAGKAESAMNALKSMMKATARVRRDGRKPRSRPNRWWSAMSSSSRPGARCRRTAASSRPAPCRSTNRR